MLILGDATLTLYLRSERQLSRACLPILLTGGRLFHVYNLTPNIWAANYSPRTEYARKHVDRGNEQKWAKAWPLILGRASQYAVMTWALAADYIRDAAEMSCV